MKRELQYDSALAMEKIIRNNNKMVKMVSDVSDNQNYVNEKLKEIEQEQERNNIDIELIGNRQDKTEKILDDYIEGGDTNLEVIDARGEYKKVGERLDNFDSQLEHNTNNGKVVYLDKFYNGDFALALKKCIETGARNIVANGVYNAGESVTFEGINNVNITGNFTINATKSLSTFLRFGFSSNIKIEGATIDFNGNENYETIRFQDCDNIKLNNINIKNVHNKNTEQASFGLYLYCNKYNVSNITFENISHVFKDENVTTGKGSIQNIYILVDSSHQFGYIDNIRSFNCRNVDSDGVTKKALVSDCDTIKTQYFEGLNDSTQLIDSKISISNVFGFNFGKRLIKLQTSGVYVDNVKAESTDGACFSCIGVHCNNVNIRNVSSKVVSAYTGIEFGYYNGNIHIENVYLNGEFKDSIVTFNGKTVDLKRLETNNISLKNFSGNVKCKWGIIIYNDIRNISFNNFNISVDCEQFIWKHDDSKNIRKLIFSSCDIVLYSNNFCDISSLEHIDILFEDIKIRHTGKGNTRLIVVNNALNDSFVKFNKFSMSTTSTYQWGYIWCNNVSYSSFIDIESNNTNTIIQNNSYTASYVNCLTPNGAISDTTTMFSTANGAVCKSFSQVSAPGAESMISKNSIVEL